MLKDITIGQYFPGKSVLHRLDPRMKILLTIGYIVMLFTVSNPLGLCVGILFLIFAYAISGIPPRMITKAGDPDHYLYHRAQHVFCQRRPAV